MATVEKKFGSIKRYGARYGRRLKDKIADIEKKSKKLGKCPFCKKLRAKRIAAGIWKCRKCGSKFTGNAYYLEEKINATQVAAEEKGVVFKSKKETTEV
jgi:large subunit ribosomal protein L37Ae